MVRGMAVQKIGALQRLLKIEPGISLVQWAYDRVTNNATLFTSVLGGAVMYALGLITDWVRAMGPMGIGGVVIATTLTIWIGLSVAQSQRASFKRKRVEAAMLEKWMEQIDHFNPLASEFHAKRIKWLDIANPISERITEKRFIDCEILGPANIVLTNESQLFGMKFISCDFVVIKPEVYVNNVLVLENVKIFGGEIWRTTIFVQPQMVEVVKPFATFITVTGDLTIDNLSPQDTGAGKPP